MIFFQVIFNVFTKVKQDKFTTKKPPTKNSPEVFEQKDYCANVIFCEHTTGNTKDELPHTCCEISVPVKFIS